MKFKLPWRTLMVLSLLWLSATDSTKAQSAQSGVAGTPAGQQRDSLKSIHLVSLPYHDSLQAVRLVSSVDVISGRALQTFPGSRLLESLSGRMPGLVVAQGSTVPGMRSAFATVRGLGVTIYVDGIQRDPGDISPYEIDKIEILKDLSARAMLGISGSNPVIWVTTKGASSLIQESNKINATIEYGLQTPTFVPSYVGAYDYALMYNRALKNDGLDTFYTAQDIEGYHQGNSAQYPNIDYYRQYSKKYSQYRHADINFSGSRGKVSYFGLVDYEGDGGLEKVGKKISSDRVKLRSNINFPINDWIRMGIGVMGGYQKLSYPNIGGGTDVFNIYNQVLSVYPANAHPVNIGDTLIVSNDYPINLYNELVNGGHGEGTVVISQNDVRLMLDLNRFVKGLTFKGVASFNILNTIEIGQGGSAPLYRIATSGLELVQQELVQPNMTLGFNSQTTSKFGTAQLNYKARIGKGSLNVDGAMLRAVDQGVNYQANELMDLSLRANYFYDNKYALQVDLIRSGSMMLPSGNRFSTYPVIGASWIVSNEKFLKRSGIINFLKVNASYGKMGINEFNVPAGYDPYHLYESMWATGGSWFSGTPTSTNTTPITIATQIGNEDIELPHRTYLSIGIDGRVLDDNLSFQAGYFENNDVNLLSVLPNSTSAIIGGGGFLPVVNFGKRRNLGVDGMVTFSQNATALKYQIGLNFLYQRIKIVNTDESPALEEYRKRSGKDGDLLWLYQADGLYQTQADIDNENISTSWGALQPGDIRYVDFNSDGVIDEKDIHSVENLHAPRWYFGLNVNLSYKRFGLFILGTAVTDGKVELNSNRYFKVNGIHQNYSEALLQSWPATNDFPRLTTTSQNNVQPSTYWIRSAAYLRLRNVELSYRIPFQKKELMIFLRGTNLLTFSGLNDFNVDPEMLNAGITDYPNLRAMTVGVTIKL